MTKQAVFIPRPGVAFVVRGKAALAKPPKLPKTPGAFGLTAKREAKRLAAKEKFLSESSLEAKRIANERTLKRAYRDWRDSMTPEELSRARALKVHFPSFPSAGCSGNGSNGHEHSDSEFRDPADLPEAASHHLPVDDIEPQSPFARAIDALDHAEFTAAAECFAAALTWSLDVPDASDLVRLGRRALLVISKLRPDLIGDVNTPAGDKAYCFVSMPADQIRATGVIFGRPLEWIRRGDRLSAIGERLCLVAYVVRPASIDSPTLARLGEVMNKTRQAKDKLAQCLRDTFSGLKSVAMRGESTRTACLNAHSH